MDFRNPMVNELIVPARDNDAKKFSDSFLGCI